MAVTVVVYETPQFVAINKERGGCVVVTASVIGLRFFTGPIDGGLWEKPTIQVVVRGGDFFLLSQPNLAGIHTMLAYPGSLVGTCIMAKARIEGDTLGPLVDSTPYAMHNAAGFTITVTGAVCRVTRK